VIVHGIPARESSAAVRIRTPSPLRATLAYFAVKGSFHSQTAKIAKHEQRTPKNSGDHRFCPGDLGGEPGMLPTLLAAEQILCKIAPWPRKPASAIPLCGSSPSCCWRFQPGCTLGDRQRHTRRQEKSHCFGRRRLRLCLGRFALSSPCRCTSCYNPLFIDLANFWRHKDVSQLWC
jgi:hypothetical protein